MFGINMVVPDDEGPEYEGQAERRPVWLIILIALLLVIIALILAYCSVQGAQEPEPTDEPTEAVTQEPTEEATEIPTEEPTPLVTEEPTDEPTEEPTEESGGEDTTPEPPEDEPTPLPPPPTEEPTEEPTAEPFCGDGICQPESENSDVCHDCGCEDNGVADPGEGCGCRDVVCEGEELESACGSPCSGGQCGSGLKCENGVCWDGFICGDVTPEPEPTEEVCPCIDYIEGEICGGIQDPDLYKDCVKTQNSECLKNPGSYCSFGAAASTP